MNDINVKLVGTPKPAADLEPLYQVLVEKNENDPLAIDAPSVVDENASSNDAVKPIEVTGGLRYEVISLNDAKDESMDVDDSPKDMGIPIVVEIAEEEEIDNESISNGEAVPTADHTKDSPQLNGNKFNKQEIEEPVIVIETKAINEAQEEKKSEINVLSSEQNTSPNIESNEEGPKSVESNDKGTDVVSIIDSDIIQIQPQPNELDEPDLKPEVTLNVLSSDTELIEDEKNIIKDLEQTVSELETKVLEPELKPPEKVVQKATVDDQKENLVAEKQNKSIHPIKPLPLVNTNNKSQSPNNEQLNSDSPSPNSDIKTDKISKSISQNDKPNEILSPVETAETTMAIETEALSIQAVIRSSDLKASSPIQDSPIEVIPDDKDISNDKDEEMVEAVAEKVDQNVTIKVVKPEVLGPPVNGDVIKEEQPIKRRPSDDLETESPLKKLCQEVEKTFPQHDTMIADFIQTATKSNIDEIQKHTEQLLAEIQTLRELAKKKEHEWNNILHLKKVKEEILLRLLRRKQVISFEKSPEINGSSSDRKDPFEYLNQGMNLTIDKSDEISGLALRHPVAPSPPMSQAPMIQPPMMPGTHFSTMTGLPPPYDKVPMQGMPNIQNMPKNMFPQSLMMPGPTMQGFPRDMNMNGGMPTNYMPMGRQGPTKDVKSIIADYRQRNPDVTPRRGRRMKSLLNPNMMNSQGPRQIAPKLDNLGNLGMIFNNLDMNQKAMLERLSQMQGASLPNGMSFKDVLVQFASMQQQGMMPIRPDMMPGRVEPPCRMEHPSRPEPPPTRPDPPRPSRRPERTPQQHHEEVQISMKSERVASSSPRLPPPPPYPEISLLPVNQESPGSNAPQNSLLHGILTKQASPSSQSCSPTLAKLLTSPELKQSSTTLPTFGQAKNCGEITITPVQPAAAVPEATPQEKPEEIVQLDDEESPASEGSAEEVGAAGSGRLVIDEASGETETPLCQGCRRRDAQFVCAGCANQWYCSRDCQVAAWDEHSEMCSG